MRHYSKMPIKAIDYSKTVIYKLVCNDLEFKELYVGSTSNFRIRKNLHKSDCNNEKSKSYNFKVYQTIRANGGWDNWSMIEIEKYSCKDKNEARARERHWYEELEAKLNTVAPNLTTEERKEYMKNRNATEERKEYIKKYNATEERKEYMHKYNATEEQQEKRKNYYATEDQKEKRKIYWATEEYKEKRKIYRATEEQKEKQKKYDAEHREERNQQSRERYAKKKAEKILISSV